jgi:hypothetical protein
MFGDAQPHIFITGSSGGDEKHFFSILARVFLCEMALAAARTAQKQYNFFQE